MLGYETWCDGSNAEQIAYAKLVIDLPRMKPIHPNLGFDFNAKG